MVRREELGSAARRPHVVMYVLDDVTFDSRVRREAATLAAAGYRVTVMGTSRNRGDREIEREEIDGYTIVRVPIPRGWEQRWQWIARPWSLRRRGVGEVHHALSQGTGGAAAILIGSQHIVAGLLLSGLRSISLAASSLHGWRAGESRGLVYPPPGVRWLGGWWRSGVLGWGYRAASLAPFAEIHHGHDLTGLPAALRAARRDGSQVVYDSHEIFLDSGSNATQPRWARTILGRLERRWAAHAEALVTVNSAYAAVLTRRLRPRRVVVVRNCPPRWEPPTAVQHPLRAVAGISNDALVALYHGGLVAHRGISRFAEALLEPGMAGVHGVLLGHGSLASTYAALADEPRFGGRLHVLPPVAPEQLLAWVADADVDVIPLEHSTLNHYLCTPNKLFESLAAGVPVVVSDFPVMRSILLDARLGALGAACDPDDPATIGRAIRAVLERSPDERRALRARCLDAAHARWNWETESARLLELYASLASV